LTSHKITKRNRNAQGVLSGNPYDAPGRLHGVWVGTDDTPTSGFWSPSNLAGTNTVRLASSEYDDGVVGDGLLTATTAYPGGSEAPRTTEYYHDWRGRTVAVKAGVQASESGGVTTINALGEARTFTDRNGTTHTYRRDILGRTIADAITTLGNGVDGAVLRLETAYNAQGQAMQLESYDAATGGTVVNQVYRQYNSFGQLTQEVQEHDGTFGAATPNFFYQYTAGLSGNHSRLTGMTYGDGYQLNYDYAPPVDDGLSRISGMSDTTGSLTSYSYLGLGAIVQELRPQNGTALSYIKQPGESDGDAGDQYNGLDRFGRVVDQRWINTSTSADNDRYQYGYDQGSRRTYRENFVASTFSELYAYDELGQLNNSQRAR
jgi:hypothetical protein